MQANESMISVAGKWLWKTTPVHSHTTTQPVYRMGQGKVKIEARGLSEAVCVLHGNEEDVNGARSQAAVFINLIVLPLVRV